MRSLLSLFRPPPTAADAPVPQLLPGWAGTRVRPPRAGVHLRRLGGMRVPTPAGPLPRLRGLEAVRGICLSRGTVRSVELLLDGRRLRVAPVVATDGAARRGLRKHVFNIWHDFAGETPGRHRLTVRASGWRGRLASRSRRIVIEPPPAPAEAPDSDAYVPRFAGDPSTPEEAVAALPSVVRPTRRSPLPDAVRAILVLRADQLGDLAVSIAAIQRLRALFPGARLVGLVTPANADLAAALGLFDALEVAAYADHPGGRRLLPAAEQERLRAALAAERFDIAVDLGEGAESRLLLLLSGARFLHGFRHGDHMWLSASFEFNARDPANGLEVMPPSRKLLALVEALGALRASEPLILPPPPDAAARLAAYGLAPDEPYIALHTGARLVPSRWPGFATLATLLLRRTRHRLLVFTHGNAWEQPAGCTGEEAARLTVIDHALPFADFDALLGHCAVLVGNDSGPKHLAALRGAKVVSLHMARLNWNEWGQEGEGLIVSRRVPCAGCNVGDAPDECGRGYPCIRDITPEEVCDAVLRLL